jgi:hypothetical protein
MEKVFCILISFPPYQPHKIHPTYSSHPIRSNLKRKEGKSQCEPSQQTGSRSHSTKPPKRHPQNIIDYFKRRTPGVMGRHKGCVGININARKERDSSPPPVLPRAGRRGSNKPQTTKKPNTSSPLSTVKQKEKSTPNQPLKRSS